MKNKKLFLSLTLAALGGLPSQSQAQLQINSGSQYLMNQAKDMSTDFGDFTNIFFFADELSSFDVAKASGTVRWKRYTLESRQYKYSIACTPENAGFPLYSLCK